MSESGNSVGKRLSELLTKYRKLLVISATALLIYSAAGFFLAPWLLEKNAVRIVRENYAAELRIDEVAVNPFVLSLQISGLQLDDPQSNPFLRIDDIFINFQATSLFRWALTLDEFRISSPEIHVTRSRSGETNLGFLTPESGETEDESNGGASTARRLLVFNFAIQDLVVHWSDDVPVEPVSTRFGPASVEILELSTLPNRLGQQVVVIETEDTGTLSWTGTLELNPFRSAGKATIEGSRFPLTSAYIRYETGFDIIDGSANAELEYMINTLDDGSLTVRVDDLGIEFSDVNINTFSQDRASDSEFLTVPSLKISGGNLRWPEQTISLDAVTVDDAGVRLNRDETGNLNVQNSNEASDTSNPENDTESAWQFSVAQFSLNRLQADIEDHSVKPTATGNVSNLNLSVAEINNTPGSQFPVTLSFDAGEGGNVSVAGDLQLLPLLSYDFDVTTDAVGLSNAQPYIEPLADMKIASGALNLNGHAHGSRDQPLLFEGGFSIEALEITETEEGTRLGSWKLMTVDKLALNLVDSDLEISEIQMLEPYGDIVIAQDGSLNFGRIDKEETSETVEKTGPVEPSSPEGDEFSVTIGRIVLTNAAADFADHSLPLPFKAKIEALNGDLTTISTTSSEPSTVTFEGTVDEYGLVRISGHVTPLRPALNTHIDVLFQNVDVPKFSSYTIPFAGREIASGSLDLDLGYAVDQGQLAGENNIILRDFELGDQVSHPDATSLPLGLAVALLKDSDGKIDIDLPVSGDINDPEFSYGGVIAKAIANLIIKIVASPFALLGNLVGIEANELENLDFYFGRSDLTPPELQKIAKLAEALALRPELTLVVTGVADPEKDGLAIRTAMLDAIIEERISVEASDDAMFSEQQQSVLETMFAEQADANLEGLRAEFTTAATEDSAENFDELAYSNELRRLLIDRQTVSESDLTVLASNRADAVRSELVSADSTLDDRIRVVEPETVEAENERTIQMKVSLSTKDPV